MNYRKRPKELTELATMVPAQAEWWIAVGHEQKCVGSHPQIPATDPDDQVEAGYRPVARMANQAKITAKKAAILRKNRTKTCGIASSHLTRGNHQLRSRFASG